MADQKREINYEAARQNQVTTTNPTTTTMAKTNSSHHTKEDIALCLGERLGEFIETKDIRIRGDWLFHRTKMELYDRYWDEVDCYWAPDARYDSGVLCMEAWDGVKMEDSPFIPRNDKKVAKSLEKLDKSYKQHLFDQTPEGKKAKEEYKKRAELINQKIKSNPALGQKVEDLYNKLSKELKERDPSKILLGVNYEDLEESGLVKEFNLDTFTGTLN